MYNDIIQCFYAYSNNRDETRITYEKVCEYVEKIRMNLKLLMLIMEMVVCYCRK